MPWLTYGLDADRLLVSITAVPSGKTDLGCPYCHGNLIAKKGKLKQHHFAHCAETCQAVADESRDLPTLPLFDKFDLHLKAIELADLQILWDSYGSQKRNIPKSKSRVPELRSLPAFKQQLLLEYHPYAKQPGYSFTKLGKIPLAALSLAEFDAVQHLKLLQKLQQLEYAIFRALHPSERFCSIALPQHLVDLQLYQVQLHRVLSSALYYLAIEADGEQFYKIGITRRSIEERLAEIQADLMPHFQTIEIEVLGVWAHYGNLEYYFKYRYRRFRKAIAQFSEYYQFPDVATAKAVLQELRRLPAKTISAVEQSILDRQPSEIEQQLASERQAYAAYEAAQQRIERQRAQQQARSQAIQTGMQRAAHWGKVLGRPRQAESADRFLAKPSSQRAIAALDQGLSLREASRAAGVSVNTVRKVKAALGAELE